MARSGKRGTRFIDRYWKQKQQARLRGIEFKLSLEEWLLWWGVDICNRGKKAGQLQMCRKNDEGAYELGNIYKDTVQGNISFSNSIKPHKKKYLSSEVVERIEATLADGVPQRKIAEMFGTNQRTVLRISKGEY